MPGQVSDRANNLQMNFSTASVLIADKKKTPARAATRCAGVSYDEVSMQQHKPSVNEHFKAAMRMAHHLPHILTKKVKRAQQKAILRELIAGLKYGLPPTKNCGSLRISA